MRPKFTRAPITDAGRVVYQGESGNVTYFVQERQGSSYAVHYPLPQITTGEKARNSELDEAEIDILHQRGAYLLPLRGVCDTIIDAYFRWVHPIVPVINKARFMKQYQDPRDPPSLLLLNAVLLAGSRYCESGNSNSPTFYKRAKALYDAGYEDDRVVIIQSTLLIGWYWEAAEDVTMNAFYWTHIAILIAQGSGMHRTVDQSQLNKPDKRLWRRIWWTLYTLDRSAAVISGRPVQINARDCDVEMLTEDDFLEHTGDGSREPPPDPVHVQFFLQYVKLCEIMGGILARHYPPGTRTEAHTLGITLDHGEVALAEWLSNCPQGVNWDATRHQFWSAILHLCYYSTLCLLHRVPIALNATSRASEDSFRSSRNAARQAATKLSRIIDALAVSSQLRHSPPGIIYSISTALIMHAYTINSFDPVARRDTLNLLHDGMAALKDLSQVWLMGKMYYSVFQPVVASISQNDQETRTTKFEADWSLSEEPDDITAPDATIEAKTGDKTATTMPMVQHELSKSCTSNSNMGQRYCWEQEAADKGPASSAVYQGPTNCVQVGDCHHGVVQTEMAMNHCEFTHLPDKEMHTWEDDAARGQCVPTTLEVNDWLQFFGVSDDASTGL